MLSSRSYLDLSPERPQDLPRRELGPEIKHEPERILRPRNKRAPKAPEMADQLAINRESAAPDRPARKRGRPRLETVKDAAAIEERRLQIRRAQRTYRLKKESTIQSLKSRVDGLERTLENVSDLLSAAHQDAASHQDGALTTQAGIDYLARARELVLAEIQNAPSTPDEDEKIQQTRKSSSDIFGYQVSYASNNTEAHLQKKDYPSYSNRARSPSPLINRILPITTIYTYSNQESNLSRRLHRFCLEHIYRWLTDARTDPVLLGRVFGLVPCIQDMPGIRRSFRRMLQSEIGSTLESNKLPFYTLGGAGKHFPRKGRNGMPIYPENSRRPGKILRRMVRILQRGGIQDWDEDWSGDREPGVAGLGHGKVEMDREERIRSLDLDGEWFDCHDIQGYLEHRGVALDGSALRLEVPAALVGHLHGFSPDRSVSSLYTSPEEVPVDRATSVSSPSPYMLDMECFFDLLLANLRILGRAPGFRVWDVDAALRAAIYRRPFS
ncbi:hypothetical protein PENARI_c007G09551 [Penicillium arizonense]|uniref:BZIP domain-containing protein n=1 Tax=Penicillium arizonense TaxID=1835702 RepID=A0A1F5LKW9_PENAI|nr:hypothetical protein PENARI_c007G09551 [Penicillium arizonense]OGE53746.1 hypothetical protein PENARI_c007G09551 [Penicillium arizonense]